MKFFIEVKTIEEAKQLYRNLAKLHHPDKGGDVEMMKAINAEYDYVCHRILSGAGFSQQEFTEAWDASQMFKDQINAIIHLPGLIIEVVGLWIWVTGETKLHRVALKDARYFFASKKIAWYWRPEHLSGGRGKYSLDELRTKYGSTQVNSSNFKTFKSIAS